MVAEAVKIAKETYLAIAMDRCQGVPIVMASPSGGMNIEEVSEKYPELILKVFRLFFLIVSLLIFRNALM